MSSVKECGLFLLIVIGLSGMWVGALVLDISQPVVQASVVAQTAPNSTILYRGNVHRTGEYDVAGPREFHQLAWQTRLGQIVHAGPVLADGTLYLATQDGKLHAIDQATGQDRWAVRLKPASEVFSSVAVTHGVVLIGTEKKRLLAFDAQSGRMLWKFKTRGIVWTAPLVVENTVYFVSDDGTAYALDLTTRQEVWKVSLGHRVLWHPVFDQGMVYVSAENVLMALDAATGRQRWKAEQSTENWWAPPSLANGVIYAGNDDGNLYALDGQTGAIRWNASGGAGNWSGPAISEGFVFIGNRSGGFFAFQAETGEQVWRFQADDWATADPVVANGVVYFGTGNHENREGQRYLFALETQSGQELWRFKADSRLMTAPAVAPGKIFVGSINGTVYAIE